MRVTRLAYLAVQSLDFDEVRSQHPVYAPAKVPLRRKLAFRALYLKGHLVSDSQFPSGRDGPLMSRSSLLALAVRALLRPFSDLLQFCVREPGAIGPFACH